MNKNKLAILFVAEAGIYVEQAKLLALSIQEFLPNVQKDTFIFCPRKQYLPDQKEIRELKRLSSAVFTYDLNRDHVDFPLANTLYSAAFFESTFPEYKSILLVDTDTVFLNQPEKGVFKPGIHVRVVDNKGVGTLGPEDPNDAFWKSLFSYFDLPLPKIALETTIRRERIRPYFNSGFTWCNAVPGFFAKWLEDFRVLMESPLRPDYVGRDGTNFGFFEQLALAITTRRYPDLIHGLPQNMNYPIPFHPLLKQENRSIPLHDLTHVHYHKWFQHPRFVDHVFDESEKNTSQFKWLQDKLPLNPTIDGPFKT